MTCLPLGNGTIFEAYRMQRRRFLQMAGIGAAALSGDFSASGRKGENGSPADIAYGVPRRACRPEFRRGPDPCRRPLRGNSRFYLLASIGLTADVTPTPDPNLAKDASFTLASAITTSSTTIYVNETIPSTLPTSGMYGQRSPDRQRNDPIHRLHEQRLAALLYGLHPQCVCDDAGQPFLGSDHVPHGQLLGLLPARSLFNAHPEQRRRRKAKVIPPRACPPPIAGRDARQPRPIGPLRRR